MDSSEKTEIIYNKILNNVRDKITFQEIIFLEQNIKKILKNDHTIDLMYIYCNLKYKELDNYTKKMLFTSRLAWIFYIDDLDFLNNNTMLLSVDETKFKEILIQPKEQFNINNINLEELIEIELICYRLLYNRLVDYVKLI